jgi:hypothetical protein
MQHTIYRTWCEHSHNITIEEASSPGHIKNNKSSFEVNERI